MDALLQAFGDFTMSDWMLVVFGVCMFGLWASGGFKGRGR